MQTKIYHKVSSYLAVINVKQLAQDFRNLTGTSCFLPQKSEETLDVLIQCTVELIL